MSLLRSLITMRLVFPLQLLTMIFFWTVPGVQADQTVIAGGGTVRQEYDSNIHRTKTDRISEWTTAFSPTMSISEIGQQHSLSFTYTPSVIYSHLTDTERWDHLLSANLVNNLAEGVSSSVKNTFVRSEDPFNDQETGITLSDSRGRNRYWTNHVAVGLDYDYGKESFVKLSYVNLVLNNDESTQDDYVKHTPGISIAQSLSQHWQTQIDYFFTKGNFEQDDDLENYASDLYIFYRPSSATKIFGHGGYTINNYNGLKADYDLARISLGFERRMSSTFDLSLSGGWSTLSSDELENQDAFYYLMSINKKLQQGALSLTGEGGIDEQHFDGISDRDLSQYWQIETAFNYNLTHNLLSALKCSYREDKYWDLTPVEKEKKIQAEASLSYTFGRWYIATVRYAYARKEADITARGYDDNRVFLTLGFNKDFFRW